MRIVFLSLTLFLFSFSLPANDEKSKRGKYWGEHPPAEEIQPEQPANEPETYSMPIIPPHAELLVMHPKEIKQLWIEAHEYHVMVPSVETAKAVLLLKDVMAKKARAAAAVESLAALGSPELTGKAEYSIQPTARSAQRKSYQETIEASLLENREEYGLVVVGQQNCPACYVYKNTLSLFQDRYGWTIKYVDFEDAPGVAERFNIQVTPTTLLISRNNKETWQPVAVGAEALSTLANSTIQGIRLINGEISPRQWLTTKQQAQSLFDPAYSPNTEVN